MQSWLRWHNNTASHVLRDTLSLWPFPSFALGSSVILCARTSPPPVGVRPFFPFQQLCLSSSTVAFFEGTDALRTYGCCSTSAAFSLTSSKMSLFFRKPEEKADLHPSRGRCACRLDLRVGRVLRDVFFSELLYCSNAPQLRQIQIAVDFSNRYFGLCWIALLNNSTVSEVQMNSPSSHLLLGFIQQHRRTEIKSKLNHRGGPGAWGPGVATPSQASETQSDLR